MNWITLVLIAALAVFIIVMALRFMRKMSGADLDANNSDLANALVLSSNQTSTTINNMPVMRLQLRIESAGQPSRTVEVKQLIQLGNIPRPGDQVCVAISQADPSKITYVGLASAIALQAAQQPRSGADNAMTPAQAQDALSISPELRENSRLGIGTILAMQPGVGSTTFTVEVDSITHPKYTVTIEQALIGKNTYTVDDRVYLFVSKTNPNVAAIVPLSYTGGKKLDRNANRLDPLVLGPQVLLEGARATGTVTTAHQIQMSTPFLAARGMQRWHLVMNIRPADGTPGYTAEQDISFVAQDRVDRICHVGAQVPIRYDAKDPRSFSTDSIAMGYPNPYDAVIAAYKDAKRKGEVT